MTTKQHTLGKSCTFTGKGLHTGATVTMTVMPAGVDHGIVFQREDLGGKRVRACIANVSGTRRSTLLRSGEATVRTTEHLLSAMLAMGVDNALVTLDSEELPILDGSAAPYAQAFLQAGLLEQPSERRYIEIPRRLVCRGLFSSSRIVMEPSSETVFDVTIDFKSKVLGVQNALWSEGGDYAEQVAPCRTFCFLSEVKALRAAGLIKGGALDNALVIDEPNGYCNNDALKFPNECARHKLLDIIGDFALLGAPVRGRITAYKPGHKINTKAALLLARHLKER